MEGAPSGDRIRLAEPMASLSLATDLGLGRPLEHELGVCLAAVELAERLGWERADVYYVALLAHIGCTGAAPDFASWAGGDEIRFQAGMLGVGIGSQPAEDMRHLVRRLADDRPLPERARRVAGLVAGGQRKFERMAANLCEGGALLAGRLRLPEPVAAALGQFFERWDGKGMPGRVAGDAMSRPMRVVHVAHDLVGIARVHDRATATAALERRRGRAYDPAVVDAALADPGALLRSAPDAWERVLAAEPEPVATLARAELASVARAFGEFADVKLGFLHGHSARVADLAAEAAEALGEDRAAVGDLRAAGHFHDLGRVAVPNGVWEKPGPLSAGEQERVRLHAYYSERVLDRSRVLAPLARLAGSHHERLDGSGYHRGAGASQLGTQARVLAAADAYDALTHDRPHRPARTAGEARAELADAVRAGALDARAVDAVLEAAGTAPVRARRDNPAGLSDREVEVLRLLAQGRSTREIARALTVTEKTAGHHVEHIYAKAGVSTRVGAALFAMRHDLAG